MNINQLKYFVSAAEHKSFTKAAEQHFISQTAITQQIKSLEEMIGCDLFDRSRRPLALTPAGEVFLIEARAVIERMSIAVLHTKEASNGLVGTLRLGYTKGYERSNLSDTMREYHTRYPNIFVGCYRDSTDRLAASLISGEYDMIYSWDSTNLCQDERVDYKLIEKARLVVALYTSHPLASRRKVFRNMLRGEKILYMSPSALTDSYGDAHFFDLYQKAGYQPDILFTSDDIESILMMVSAEEGISILPEYSINKLHNPDNLVFIPLEGEEEVEEIVAIWLKDNQNPALSRFLTIIE